jgi:hypothetical protein
LNVNVSFRICKRAHPIRITRFGSSGSNQPGEQRYKVMESHLLKREHQILYPGDTPQKLLFFDIVHFGSRV